MIGSDTLIFLSVCFRPTSISTPLRINIFRNLHLGIGPKAGIIFRAARESVLRRVPMDRLPVSEGPPPVSAVLRAVLDASSWPTARTSRTAA